MSCSMEVKWVLQETSLLISQSGLYAEIKKIVDKAFKMWKSRKVVDPNYILIGI